MNGIDFEQELYKHFGQVKDFTLGMRIGKYFYELGKQSGSSEVPNDLEEAAIQYATHKKKSEEKEMETELPMVAYYLARDSFIVGAKWDKEQMMKEAMDAIVEDWNSDPEPEITIPLNPEEFTCGDKVRVIICKEED